MKNKKRNSLNEFRYNYDTKHINYIFEEEGKRYHSVGLTHDHHTFGKKNMPLYDNPQKNRTEKSYIRNGIISNKKSSFSKHKDKNYKFSLRDFKNVKSKIRKYKSYRKYKKK